MGIASTEEATKEIHDSCTPGWLCIGEAVDLKDHTADDTLHNMFWMGRMEWNIQVEV